MGVALEDIARLVSPRRPEVALRILQCFMPDNEGVTKAQLLQRTGLKLKSLEYYLTILRCWRLISSQRRRGQPSLYFLEPVGFHSKLDTLFVDPLRVLRRS